MPERGTTCAEVKGGGKVGWVNGGRYDDRSLAELVDYVIDMTEEEKRIQQSRKESAKDGH
jgi:hypothetical protein